MINYVVQIFRWIKQCKNWNVIVALHLGFLKGDICLKLRNGLKLKLINKGIDSDTAVVGDIYFNQPYTRDGFGINDGDTIVYIGTNTGVFSTFATTLANNVKALHMNLHQRIFLTSRHLSF